MFDLTGYYSYYGGRQKSGTRELWQPVHYSQDMNQLDVWNIAA